MHYYKKNIGDYAKKAGRLTMLQHGAFTLLLDSCYDRERFPSMEEAIEWTWASNQQEIEAVEFVLKKFFVLEDGKYVQARIQEELAKYHENSQTNKRIAIERETKRKEKSTKRVQVVHEPPPNQEPLTTNHKPITKSQKATSVACPDFINKQVWADWMIVRKEKGGKTLTETAWKEFCKQAEKAGWSIEQAITHCCLKGWIGFHADWVQNKSQDVVRQTTPTPANAFDALQKIRESDKMAVKPPAEILEKMALLRKGVA